MIVCCFEGGLGNQLFNYALGLSLSKIKKVDLFFDLLKLQNTKSLKLALNCFNIPDKREVSPFLRGFFLGRKNHVSLLLPESLKYESVKEDDKWWVCRTELKYIKTKNIYLQGVFAFPELFTNIIPELKEQIQLSENKKSSRFRYFENIIISTPNPVCLHIRRGDYVSAQLSSIFKIIDENYYTRAIEYIYSMVPDCKIFIFFDTVDYNLLSNLSIENSVQISDNNLSDVEEFELMRICRHHITANSTFSWWATFLSSQGGITIMPEVWYTNPNAQEAYSENTLLYNTAAIKI
jgi:hypothetical protein